MSGMEGLSVVQEVLELALYTGLVENVKPLSVLLCSKSENGKTSALEKFRGNEGVVWLEDATKFGIYKSMFLSKEYLRCRHLIISDLNIPLQRSKDTANTFMSMLMPMTYEGVQRIETFNMSLKLPVPAVIGVLAGITPAVFHPRKQQWADIGILRRFMPLSYDYNEEVVNQVFHNIQHRTGHENGHIPLHNLLGNPEMKMDIKLDPKLAKELEPMARNMVIGLNIGTPYKGFSYQEQLQALAMGRAYKNKRRNVLSEDIHWIKTVAAKYINYNQAEI